MTPEEILATSGASRNGTWLRAIRSLSNDEFEQLVQMQDAEDASHEEFLTSVFDKPSPEALQEAQADTSWIDQMLKGVARQAAIKDGLIEPTPFDRPEPFHMNL